MYVINWGSLMVITCSVSPPRKTELDWRFDWFTDHLFHSTTLTVSSTYHCPGNHSNCTALPLTHGEMVRLDEGRFPALELNNRRLSVKNSFCRKNGIYTRSVPDRTSGPAAFISCALHLSGILLARPCLSFFLLLFSVLLVILTGINNVVLCVPPLASQ